MKVFVGVFAVLAGFVAFITHYLLGETQSVSANDQMFWSTVAFGGTFVFLFVYCLPILIAQARKHPQLAPIVVLNIIAGWSGIFWIAALVWSLIDNKPPAPAAQSTSQPPGYQGNSSPS